ncbi:type II secretion system ATPase GspE [Hyphococcus luteus]|uniref:Type II secretion system protein E n=1 Tax=Hyphococcus luteus TaxID=2058213 RepID=A0A2S7K2T6_9PROT|nr:type II secretion system ATPase GspE [Marinicaulis flavus]PQA86807.1 type II secretion system protein GspE [Marinicaulis flavus]
MSETRERGMARLAYAFAKERGLLVLDGEAEPVLLGARGKAPDPWAVIEARRAVGAPVAVDLMPADVFERRLSEIYSVEGISTADLDLDGDEGDLASLAEGLPKTADLLDSENDAPVIRLINALIAEAVKVKASDIHIEPYEKALSVRLRIDGVLREVLSLPARMTPVLTSRVKVMARLDIAERRVPQDGRISIALGGKTVDVRVSTLPARFGERVVMRILDKDEARLDLDGLGMPAEILARFKQALARPNGIILVTGPTGSGKTTTLYGALTLLNEPERNILTVEDPVEYAIEGVGQTQINPKVGMTFATGLRAILRQDPDIVMVGEIRDVETAEIAVQASLTGHLVLSTVHTNSAVGAITRLRDMGVEPFLLSSTLAAVMAQRLVRRLCPSCKEAYEPDAAERKMAGLRDGEAATLYRPVGCGRCNNTGYEGRIGVYELIVIDEKLKRFIHDGAGEQDIAAYAFAHADTLTQSGLRHVRSGLTSIEEVLRVVRQEEDNAGL